MSDSFWVLPEKPEETTPHQILRDQAVQLRRLTQGKLVGQVEREVDGERFYSELKIIVPNLNDFEFVVLRASYPLDSYPVRINLPWGAGAPEPLIEDEEALLAYLKRLLASKEMKRLLAKLLAQAS